MCDRHFIRMHTVNGHYSNRGALRLSAISGGVSASLKRKSIDKSPKTLHGKVRGNKSSGKYHKSEYQVLPRLRKEKQQTSKKQKLKSSKQKSRKSKREVTIERNLRDFMSDKVDVGKSYISSINTSAFYIAKPPSSSTVLFSVLLPLSLVGLIINHRKRITSLISKMPRLIRRVPSLIMRRKNIEENDAYAIGEEKTSDIVEENEHSVALDTMKHTHNSTHTLDNDVSTESASEHAKTQAFERHEEADVLSKFMKETIESAYDGTRDAMMELRERWILPLAAHTTGYRRHSAAPIAHDSFETTAHLLDARLWIAKWRDKNAFMSAPDSTMDRSSEFEVHAIIAEKEAFGILRLHFPDLAEKAEEILLKNTVSGVESRKSSMDARAAAWSVLLELIDEDCNFYGKAAKQYVNLAQEAWSRSANTLEKEILLEDLLQDMEPSESLSSIELLELDNDYSTSRTTTTTIEHANSSSTITDAIEVATVATPNTSLVRFLHSAFHREKESEDPPLDESHMKKSINLDPIQDLKVWLQNK